MELLIAVEPGTPTVGLWCPHCVLPSAFSMPLNLLTASGVTTLLTPYVACYDCGRRL